MANGNGRVTLAVLGTKVDNQTKAIEGLLEAFKQHVEKDRTIEIKVDRLEQTEASRVWHIRTLWVAVLGIVAAWFK